MEPAALIRTGSGRFQLPSPAEHLHLHHDLPRLSRTLSTGAGGFSSRSSTAVHLEMRDNCQHSHRRDVCGAPRPNTLRRAASCDLGSSGSSCFLNDDGSSAVLSVGFSGRGVAKSASPSTSNATLMGKEVELEFCGGGAGRGNGVRGAGRPGGGSGDQHRGMEAYYKEMLQTDPENPLLHMNYGKFLQEVEGDLQGAENCFGRAILASPGDGEALSLYGNLMWEAHRDEQTADDYFQRAVQAAPDDCYVLGSYAHFLWDADEGGDGGLAAAVGRVVAVHDR